MRRVVSLWLPFWPTDRLRRHRYAGLPVDVPLVTRGHDGRRMVIAAACASARGLGLRDGMPLAHAQAMVPELTIVDATPADDDQALQRLAAWCLRLSPMTAPDPPDGVWIDATGCTHLHGGEPAMLSLLAAFLSRSGLTGRLAIADTPGAAHALARHGEYSVAVIAPGDHAATVTPLPIEALRIDREIAAALRRLGLETIGQLLATPRAPLARRFGDALLTRLDQVTGRVREPIQPVLPSDMVAIRRTFVEPLSTAEAFVTVILVLVGEACVLLEQRGEGARRLDLMFERVDGTVQVIRIGTARPVRDVRHLARLLDERIEEVDPGPSVEAMRLVLPLVEPLAHTQRSGGLVPGERDETDLSELIDRLVNRLGADNVYRLQTVESDVPERSQRPVSVAAAGAALGTAADLSAPSWPRPTRLLDPPEPVEALAMMPDHPPKAFTWRRVRHRILRADGPERITGEWWRRSAELLAVRDYWIVENQDGRRFWLFRQGDGVDPTTGRCGGWLPLTASECQAGLLSGKPKQEPSAMEITTIGLDLAKHVFQVHGVDAAGKPIVRKALRRAQVLPFFAKLAPCLIGIEACGTSHHWARELIGLGHTVKLMPPAYVKPYVKRGKTDAADAEAICEAVTRPTMRFVPVKSREQQAALSMHRTRDLLVKQRTQLVNMMRGLLAEFGIAIPEGLERALLMARQVVDGAVPDVPAAAVRIIGMLSEQTLEAHARLREIDRALVVMQRTDDMARRLATIPGIGPVGATALAAAVTDPGQFRLGRQFAAWLGLTPLQNSSGGKERLGRITKMGDKYLRKLLVVGATSLVRRARHKPETTDQRLVALLARKPVRVATVAMANKMARIVWAVMTRGETYQNSHAPMLAAA